MVACETPRCDALLAGPLFVEMQNSCIVIDFEPNADVRTEVESEYVKDYPEVLHRLPGKSKISVPRSVATACTEIII